MLKNFSKLLFLLLTILIISSTSICYATEAVKTSETDEATNTVVTTGTASTEETTSEDNNYYGDLYIFDNKVLLDKIVYGNVYIIGNQVEITGQIEGNLFVVARDLNLNKCLSNGNIYAFANNINYNAVCTYLYAYANNIEMAYDCCVVRDAYIKATNSLIKTAIGRNLDLISSKITLGENDEFSIIYGDFKYTSNNEIDIPAGVMTDTGTVTFKPSHYVLNILISFLTIIITTLGLCVISVKVTPNFNKKLINSNLSLTNLLKAFVIGLVSLLVIMLLEIILILSMVGIKFAILFALLYAILSLISVPYLTIFVANKLKPAFKIEKTSMLYLVISLVSILLYGITLIPFVGTILGIIIKLTSIGLLVNTFIPHKELTEEEKTIKEEKKTEKKLNKEKRKQEKLEAKIAKKQTKLEAKENKKNNSTDL